MSKALETTKQDKIKAFLSEFRDSVQSSADAMKRAAVAYYSALKVDPSARDTFALEFPTVASATWNGFVKIAEGQLDERLLFDGTAAGRALAKCDSTSQQYYLENPLPVSCGSGDTMLVSLDKMTSDQARQVFNHGVIRDIPEQRAWIETQRTRAQIKARIPTDAINAVFVSGKHLHVGDVKLTQADLLKYLGQMV